MSVAVSPSALALAHSILKLYPASANMIRGLPYNVPQQLAEAKAMTPAMKAAVQTAAQELGGALTAEAAAKQTPAQAAADAAWYKQYGFTAASWEDAIAQDGDKIADIKDAYGLDAPGGAMKAAALSPLLILAGLALGYMVLRK